MREGRRTIGGWSVTDRRDVKEGKGRGEDMRRENRRRQERLESVNQRMRKGSERGGVKKTGTGQIRK